MYQEIEMGYCPIGKTLFSDEDALNYKRQIEQKLIEMQVNYIGIDDAVRDGIIRSQSDVEPAVKFLKSKSVDCIFIPHCNFGTEGAVGMLGRRMNVPVLLWGPRDTAPLPDGTRLRDSLCGMFASSKVLNKLKVNFTYIDNCCIDDEIFKYGIDKFIRAANVVKRFKSAKIGLIGNRIDFFWSTIFNENELLQRFGIEVLPYDLVKFIRLARIKAETGRQAYVSEINGLKSEIDISRVPQDSMINILAARDAMLEFAEKNGLSALAVESFMSVIEELNTYISFSQSLVCDRGIPCISESDIHGAVSSIIAEAAALNQEPSFFSDLTIRHPQNDNGLLLWHDAFPYSLISANCKAVLGTHWILPSDLSGMCHWKLKDGEITIVRFDGEEGDYRLLAKECRTIDGPFTQNTYVWVEMGDYNQFERKVIKGPYIHHTACIYGHYSEVLKEACKYIEGLTFDAS